MALFKVIPKSKRGQHQEVSCPRCLVVLEGEEVYTSGEGLGIRKVEGTYSCPCGYSIIVTERYPMINRPFE